MHLYWRIMEELNFLGETLTIQDPSLKREFDRWYKRHRIDTIWLVYLRHDRHLEN